MKRIEMRSPSRDLWILLAAILVVVRLSAFGQTGSDPWLIQTNGAKDPINAHTSRQDLVKMYGASNVADQDVGVGEGETEPGTVVFPSDPQRRIEILWRDPDKKTQPASAQISGDSSRWHAVHGISLGTSLKEIEKANGQPFHLAGLDWDYSGTILSWGKGSLAEELGEAAGAHGRVILRLDSTQGTEVSQSEEMQVSGDRDFLSSHPVMQKLNPRAYQIIWVFKE